jgi:putative ABC transport system ATP-binding protein
VADLIAEHLRRSYGQGATRVVVLRDVSLSLERGQLVLLMGPSGSGKSTLLALLAGLARPDSGRVVALGKDLWSLSEKQQEQFRLEHVGFVFQGYNLFPSLTAREQLEMVVRWGEGASAREASLRAGELLAELGLSDKGDLLPAQMSGGEKQRVAIARALIKRPALCFADEPTAALDWTVGQHVIHLLRDASRRHNALMFVVAHDARLMPYADLVLHLDSGRLVEEQAVPVFTGEGNP